jgi:hypothetical protein
VYCPVCNTTIRDNDEVTIAASYVRHTHPCHRAWRQQQGYQGSQE